MNSIQMTGSLTHNVADAHAQFTKDAADWSRGIAGLACAQVVDMAGSPSYDVDMVEESIATLENACGVARDLLERRRPTAEPAADDDDVVCPPFRYHSLNPDTGMCGNCGKKVDPIS